MKKLSFCGVVLPQNPSSLSVVYTRRVSSQSAMEGDITQDFGRSHIVVSGEGVVKGAAGKAALSKLRELCTSGSVGTLVLMNNITMTARLVSFTEEGCSSPDRWQYQFTFWEEMDTAASQKTALLPGRVYRAKEGDSLWSIGQMFHIPTADLQRCNPRLQWSGWLSEGEEVALS